jgi:TRAP-type C4-dicarboxylate transport system permease small subunit
MPHRENDEEGRSMRRVLDWLYDGAAWLAALAMIGVLVMVLLSIVSRQLGFHVPGTDAYAGYSMAAAGFLALAHTLKRNEHIRVTLLLGRLQGKARRALELWALSAGVLLAGLFALYAVRLAWNSRAFNDISTGNDATPLWIPQLAMALGTLILLVAFVDEWVQELRGGRRSGESEEALHNE